jgi:hypothetical protein
MKLLLMNLMILLTTINIYASEADQMFWNEVKNSNDIELLKLYKQNYPNGIFKSLANIKIKRLKQIQNIKTNQAKIPLWLKGFSQKYQYYGVGKANKHFKGKDYQENLARSRARRDLQEKLDKAKLSNKLLFQYNELIETKKYIDKNGRIYILLFIDNFNL